MKLEADLHVHSVASGHAYSTIAENVQAAAKKGLKLIAITDHGPDMPGGPNLYHFGNLRAVPKHYQGVEILKGVEANIIDKEGNVDVPEVYLKMLDIILAGFHTYCSPTGTVAQNTKTMIKVMSNPLVDVIVHPGNPEFKVDPTEIILAAKENGILLEINNSSLGLSRAGSYCNCMAIAEKAAEHKIQVAVGSDAHWADRVGDFISAIELLKKVGIGEEQIINRSGDKIHSYLQGRRQRHS
ncbi:MAG: hydrolase [Desulfitibacter sp. BRH_c19]|nr:MAG: hydrolase [Desulfitibacter sp. BRH_c19]